MPLLGKFRTRLQRAQARLASLQRMPHDIRTKAFLIMGGIYPAGLYGVELLPLGTIHMDVMRTQVSNALLGPSRSRNSAISVACAPHLLDPLVYAVVRCLRAAQRFLLKVDDVTQQAFFDLAARHSGRSYDCHGPAGTLTYYLLKIGWTLDKHGQIHTDQFVSFDLLTTSIRTLQIWVERAWIRDMLTYETERKILSHLSIDVISTIQVLQKFSVFQQHFLLEEISGGFQTEVQKSKWAQDASGQCLHCEELDTREHRVFHCAATADVRAPFQNLLTDMTEFSLIHELPVIFTHENFHTFHTVNEKHVEAQIPLKHLEIIRAWIEQGVTPTFYTDGSVKHPHSPLTRTAAYSIVLDVCRDDQQRQQVMLNTPRGVPPESQIPLAAARTTGNQTVYRSELFAVVRIVECFSASDIFSDSAATVKTFSRCQRASSLEDLQNLGERDLVFRLWESLRMGTHKIHKLKAHRDVDAVENVLDRYHAWGNYVADTEAGRVGNELDLDYLRFAGQMHDDLCEGKEKLQKIFDLLLKLHKQRATLHAALERQKGVDQTVHLSHEQQVQILVNWQISNVWQRDSVRVDRSFSSAWGPRWALAFRKWAEQVVWPDPGIQQELLSWSLC
eukprot:Skav221247  [mRNA]  locus=scaffold1045:300146:301999:+ [translate_table: standard]